MRWPPGSGPAGENLVCSADARAERSLYQPAPGSCGVLAGEMNPPDRSADWPMLGFALRRPGA